MKFPKLCRNSTSYSTIQPLPQLKTFPNPKSMCFQNTVATVAKLKVRQKSWQIVTKTFLKSEKNHTFYHTGGAKHFWRLCVHEQIDILLCAPLDYMLSWNVNDYAQFLTVSHMALRILVSSHLIKTCQTICK